MGDAIITMGCAEDLESVTRQAASRMLDWICARTELSRLKAYRHASMLANLSITQVINGQKGVRCRLDRRSLVGARGA